MDLWSKKEEFWAEEDGIVRRRTNAEFYGRNPRLGMHKEFCRDFFMDSDLEVLEAFRQHVWWAAWELFGLLAEGFTKHLCLQSPKCTRGLVSKDNDLYSS